MIGACLVASLVMAGDVRVGSKAFTESVILGELATQLIAATGERVEHKQQIGGTRLVFAALVNGDIDVYAEYTGTLREELFPQARTPEALTMALRAQGVMASKPLGFNNTYGLAMREDTAQRLGIRRISDLAAHPGVVFGLSNELMDRKDGWPSLSSTYALAPTDVRGLDHDIAYRALVSGAIGVTDCYTTDAEITHHHLRVLEDDRRHFPRYDAVFLYRTQLSRAAVEALTSLENTIDEPEMAAMNAQARIDRVAEPAVAAQFVSKRLARRLAGSAGFASEEGARGETRVARLVRRTREHMLLVGAAFVLSVLIAFPLGIIAAKRRRLGQAVLAVVGVMQTVPSLALLVLMVPLLGIGSLPAVVAMVLYGLLPIVRSTFIGLTTIEPALLDSARALGLTDHARLMKVELPLAAPAILAGMQTSAVIAVGTATIGALVGAGGYGQSILTGVRLADTTLLLEGAVPAALMSLAIQLGFTMLERVIVPRGLRLTTATR